MINSKQVFICKICKIEFSKAWQHFLRFKDKTLLYCSRKCKTVDQRGNLSKSSIESKILELIEFNNRYMTVAEILKELKMSTKTFTKYRISVKELNNKLGFIKAKSKFEEDVFNCLKYIFHTVHREVCFDKLTSPKGFPLRYDFYIPDSELLIEADGNQHYYKTNPRYSDYANQCDDIKSNFASSNNIALIRVPYTRKVTENYVRKYLIAVLTTA